MLLTSEVVLVAMGCAMGMHSHLQPHAVLESEDEIISRIIIDHHADPMHGDTVSLVHEAHHLQQRKRRVHCSENVALLHHDHIVTSFLT